MINPFEYPRLIVSVVLLFLALGVVHTIYKKGQENAVSKIERQNTKGLKDATDARTECSRDPAGCLRDEWLRDN